MLARYLTTELPPPPIAVDWSKGITQFGSMLNDSLGDCTCAGRAHAIQIWTANAGKQITLTDDQVLASYEKFCGYVNGDESTDNGGVELDVLTDWQKEGPALDGHGLVAFADPDCANLTEIKQAINIFGGLYIGMNVPQSVMDNASDPTVPWDVNGNNTSVGGHCVFVIGYDSTYLYFISWGQIYKMTIAFWQANVDEAHALIAQDFIDAASGEDPQGLNLTQLLADKAMIR